MKARHISLPALHLFHLLGIIRNVEPCKVHIFGRVYWKIVAETRWSKRALLDDPFPTPNLITPSRRNSSRLFSTRHAAIDFLRTSGLRSIHRAG